MKTSLKVSRGAQLLGAVAMIVGIVSCTNRGDPQAMSLYFIAGFALILGARIFEWFSKA